MIQESFTPGCRKLRTVSLSADFVVVGGGLSGVCAAVTAARAGTRTVLIQDRPVLGGNASSEVRLWILGATSHMGNNNRWSREGGLIDEILLENMYRNREGNPVILDTIILEKVRSEANITLLLNTSVYDAEKHGEKQISKVFGFCSQNYTFYEVQGSLFCDASGDGVLGYLSGASYRMGAEEKEVYGEKFAPDKGEYGELLGHSIYFYSKDTGRPVKFVPPAYALKDIERIPRWEKIDAGEHGCKFWWLEYGGRLDTIHDTEEIKWEIWSVVYGVWDHIKNSGLFPEAENLTLEWVGVIPGKRESRRFKGLYTLTQQDIVEQQRHPDTVAFGGWAIDLHPAEGVYSTHNGCIQYHSKGVYEIPYRCFVGEDVENLFFAGRCMSASHVAHGSSRVMATSGFCAQAVGMAAAICLDKGLMPSDMCAERNMRLLQQRLNLTGQSIPGTSIDISSNLASRACISASSELELKSIPFDGPWTRLDYSAAQMLPMKKDVRYSFTVEAMAECDTGMTVRLMCSATPHNYTPDTCVGEIKLELKKGTQAVEFTFAESLPHDQYGFVAFMRNDRVLLRSSEFRCTGIVSVFNKFNAAVNNNGKQIAPEGSGIDSFEFWCPDRRPEGRNIAMGIRPGIKYYAADLVNGLVRPGNGTNAWAASLEDPGPSITFKWDGPIVINNIKLFFDTDYDHAVESVQMGHSENVMPFCVGNYTITDADGNTIFSKTGNHQTVNTIHFDEPVVTDSLTIKLEKRLDTVPVSLFQVVAD